MPLQLAEGLGDIQPLSVQGLRAAWTMLSKSSVDGGDDQRVDFS